MINLETGNLIKIFNEMLFNLIVSEQNRKGLEKGIFCENERKKILLFRKLEF